MPHLPDDDGYEPPLKVLRKRFNGVYREDHGLSGPTRRYILLVAMLVALASVPTLAVITAGTSEIAGDDRGRAMDAPFLPPPVSGPVRPSPQTKGHSAYDYPARPPSVSDQPSTVPPSVLPPPADVADPIPTVPDLPSVPDEDPPTTPVHRKSPVDDRPKPAGEGRPPARVKPFPTVPGLPAVPDDDWELPLARRAPAGYDDSSWDKTDSSDNADSGDDPDARGDETPTDSPDRHDDSGASDEDDADHDGSEDPDAGDAPHHKCAAATRSSISDRPRTGPTPAGGQQVTERPHNVNAARIVEYSYPAGRNVRRSMAQPSTEEGRITNRPYRGHHRAEHTQHDEETPARQRSSRVGRHHLDHSGGDHHANHR
ncbi:hypothetical protein [Actinoplanes sp. HUAS TT8]|uniref:hypothetical protein n=1 Tax=Actinoplanes sp. HUAS TT8 TaxID=3447453 RepID=UPI003F526437